VLLTLLPLSLALFLTFFLKEPYYEKEEHKSMVKHIGKSLTDIVRNKQILLLFTSGFILFAFGESTHLLKSIFFEFKHIPVTYFGYIFGLTFGLSSLGHYFSHDVSEKIGNKMTLVLYALIFPIFMLLATQAFGLSAAVLIAIPSIVYGLRNPVVDHMLNLEVKSKNRATILSINSLVQRLGIVIFAPIVGYLADLYTINTAYMISAILMFSAVFLLLLLKDRK